MIGIKDRFFKTRNCRSSQGPLYKIHLCWMSLPALDKGNLHQPFLASTRESEKSWPGLWLQWIMCRNSTYFKLCFCEAAYPFNQRLTVFAALYIFFNCKSYLWLFGCGDAAKEGEEKDHLDNKSIHEPLGVTLGSLYWGCHTQKPPLAKTWIFSSSFFLWTLKFWKCTLGERKKITTNLKSNKLRKSNI